MELDSLIERASEHVVSVLAVPAVQSVVEFSIESLENGEEREKAKFVC